MPTTPLPPHQSYCANQAGLELKDVVPLTFYLPAFTTQEQEQEAMQSDKGDYKAFIAYNAARMAELEAEGPAGAPASSSKVQCITHRLPC
jgi:hypothetical protein